MEKRTSYAYSVKNLAEPSFDQIHALSRKYIMSLSQELQNELFDELNHGVELIDSEPLMQEYLFSFGQMHRAKLRLAFEHIDKEVWAHESLSIIDYGCGQGIATMCLVDYLREKGFDVSRIRSVRLIEPSALCLDRAELHVHQFLPDAKIIPIRKSLNDLTTEDVATESSCTIHLFSNVLDIQEIDLDRLTSLLNEVDYPVAEFICVDPYTRICNCDIRLDLFALKIKYGILTFAEADTNLQSCWYASYSVRIITGLSQFECDFNTIYNLGKQYRLHKRGDTLNKNPQLALKLWTWAAEKGNAESQTAAGYCYLKGVSPDIQENIGSALNWFQKAVSKNYKKAQYLLGVCYANGIGVEKDFSKAISLLKLSAEQGYVQAYKALGLIYASDSNSEKNLTVAHEYLKKAALTKDQFSMKYLKMIIQSKGIANCDSIIATL